MSINSTVSTRLYRRGTGPDKLKVDYETAPGPGQDRRRGALASGRNILQAQDEPRGTIAEWTITILLLLFGTTTLVQAFVIPTGSMEDTLLIGDHLLVDKLAYAPPRPGQQVHSAL